MKFSKIDKQLIGKELLFPIFTEAGHVWVNNIPLELRDIETLKLEGFTHVFIKEESVVDIRHAQELIAPLQPHISPKLYETLRMLLKTSGDFRVLVSAIQEYDEKTFRHSLTTAQTAIAMCEKNGCGELDILRVAIAALLHDVGKCCIPITLLNRTGVLDERARWLMEKHVWYSYLVLSFVWDSDLAVLAYTHHERVDGTGYPRKLHGDEISELSKIIIMSDVFSALTEIRAYKEAYEVNTALEIICSCFSEEKQLCAVLQEVVS